MSRAEAQARLTAGQIDTMRSAIDAHLGRLLLSDLRYSMGRPTAAPDDCSRGIRQLWHMADAEWRALVLRDLREYVARRNRVDDVCHDVWTELLAWMEGQG